MNNFSKYMTKLKKNVKRIMLHDYYFFTKRLSIISSNISYIVFIYFGFVGFQVYLSYGDIPMKTSISVIIAPILAWWAGKGLLESICLGTMEQKIGGFFMAILFFLISFYLISSTGFSTRGYISLNGATLLIISFVLGFVRNSRQ